MQILIIDDHSLFRQGLSQLLRRLRPRPVIAESGSGRDGLTLALTQKAPFDLVLLDIHLPDLDGRSVLKRLLKAQPKAKAVILTGSADAATVHSCLRAGAVGYLSKNTDAKEMLAAVRKALAGHIVLPEGGTPLTSPLRSRPSLPPSQIQVLRLLCLGKTNKEIAHDLGLSANTIRNHLALIFRSLDVRTRTEAAHRARSLGLV